MVIQIKHNGKQYYLQSKPVRRSPEITPIRGRAWKFSNLSSCKNVRDDVLEYFPNSVIVA